jgi:hypothetical protein
MYASTYICTRLNEDGSMPLPRPGSASQPGSPDFRRHGAGRSVSTDGSFDDADDYRGRSISPKMTRANQDSGNNLKDLDLGPPGLEN